MKEEGPKVQKLKYVLKQISKQKGESTLIELIDYSFFEFESYWSYKGSAKDCKLKIFLRSDIYAKNYDFKKDLQEIVKARVNNSTNDFCVILTEILPDYDKLEIISLEIKPVYTEWEEINLNQQKLIETLQRSNDSLDYQAIGNLSRTIMDKLARKVFNPDIHVAEDPSIELHNGKYKNQLNTYIYHGLQGQSNKNLRKLAQSTIEFVGNSIDLMNATTHKLNTEKHFAELCVISALSAINIIKTISDLKK